LKTLFDPQTHIYTSIENRTNDYTYDNPTDHLVELEPWMTVVTARLTDLLQRHGAVETKLPLFIPETLLLQAFPDLAPVRLLDKSGKIIQLPSSDLLSMARSATRRQIERIKRYHIGRRYRDHVSGGQPNAEEEVSFDIISPIRSWAAEAECLDVVDKVVMEMGGSRGVSGEFEIHISHETGNSIAPFGNDPVHANGQSLLPCSMLCRNEQGLVF
jgi:translation initiation factor 2-alpha kinase 4